MKSLYFIRHGQSVMNVSDRWSSRTDTPLTDKGRAQAKKAGEAAKALGIDCIVSSPLSRALETAQIIAGMIGLDKDKVLVNDLLKERDLGILEGTPYIRGLKDFSKIKGVEPEEELIKRADKALAWINSLEAERVLIAAHGSIGRAIRSVLLAEYPMSHPDHLKNAEIVCWIEKN